MKKSVLLSLLLFLFFKVSAQTPQLNTKINLELSKKIESLRTNNQISADSAYRILATWNRYPLLKQTNQYYLFTYQDASFGTIPVKVFVPANYQPDKAHPVVLILHGAVVLSSFKDAYKKDTISDEDIFYDYFKKQNYIIVRPFADGFGPHADGSKNFDWVNDRHQGKPNPTFQALVNMIAELKQHLNVDDRKVFAFGHSDGSDGAVMLSVFKPSIFAGSVAYNSMLTNIGAHNIYLQNTQNRPLVLVHSSLDDLRPVEQTKIMVTKLKDLKFPVLYREYAGYKHYDKHLTKDLPLTVQWMQATNREAFPKNVYWETSNTMYNTCDWLRITAFDTTQKKATWHRELNFTSYNKIDKKFEDYPYYPMITKSAAVKASYQNNTFHLETSRAQEVELYISPEMVDLRKPVTIYVNGNLVFQKKVVANKAFLLNTFQRNRDRQRLWVASIKVKWS